MQFLWKYVDEFVGKGIGISILAELFTYAMMNFVPLAIPLSILLASIMTFGSLTEFMELSALKTSGISYLRIIKPLFYLVLFISIFSLLFANYVIPTANLKFYSLLFDVRNQRPDIMIKPGIFYNGIDNYVIKVSKIDHNKRMMYNIIIYDHTNLKGNTTVLIADSGKLYLSKNKDFLLLNLYKGIKYEELISDNWKKNYNFQKIEFNEYFQKIPISGFSFKRTDESLFKDHYRMQSLKQLKKNIDSLEKNLNDYYKNFLNNIILNDFFSHLNEINEKNFNIKDSTLFKKYYLALNNFKDRKKIIRILDEMRNSQVYTEITIDEVYSKKSWIIRHYIEFYQKITMSISCILFFFIGAPLGIMIKRGGLGLPIVVSVFLFVFYYIISITGEKFVKEFIWPPFFGMFFSSFIILFFAILLNYIALFDKELNIIEYYYKIYNKFHKLLKNGSFSFT